MYSALVFFFELHAGPIDFSLVMGHLIESPWMARPRGQLSFQGREQPLDASLCSTGRSGPTYRHSVGRLLFPKMNDTIMIGIWFLSGRRKSHGQMDRLHRLKHIASREGDHLTLQFRLCI